MTGGAGFTISGIKSSKDNRNLGKIRPKAGPDGISRADNIEKADLKSIDESIQLRLKRHSSASRSGYLLLILVILFFFWVAWSFFN